MPPCSRRRWILAAVIPISLALPGCATLQQVAALPQVRFFIDRASDADLAGIDLGGLRRVEDLRATDALLIANAVRRKRLPLRFDLHVGAENASPHRYDLRLERLEWTLLLEDRETVSGVFARDLVIGSAGVTDIPISIELDLLRFFDEGASDLVGLSLRAAGAGGPTNVKLRARPTLRTPLGPVRFPNEITIVHRPV
jgi:hypothetical protein